jgi:zinc/manganese transport system substrate-binding protein
MVRYAHYTHFHRGIGFMKHLGIRVGLLCLLLGMVAPAQADITVVATTPNLGMLVREIGGPSMDLRVLAREDRDLRFVEFRPSMMTALRRAMILVAGGTELEATWLPMALRAANNARVMPGQIGYFDATEHMQLLPYPIPVEGGEAAPANSFFSLDPERMASLARAIAEQMAVMRPGRADEFRANAAAFANQVAERMPAWKSAAAGKPGVLLYHIDQAYLLDRLGVEVLGYIQTAPNDPPSTEHLVDLMMNLRGVTGVVWISDRQPVNAAAMVANQLEWPLHSLPIQVDPETGTAEDYFALIDAWVAALSPTN